MAESGITVVIPTIPERAQLCARAVESVVAQTLAPDAILVVPDAEKRGAAATRTKGLMMVQTPWVAFLDDDDEFLSRHLERLSAYQRKTKADMVFPWFEVRGGTDPFPANFDREFDVEDPHQTTVTILVRTDAAKAVGGYLGHDDMGELTAPDVDSEGHRPGEEFRFAIKLARAGYRIAHLRERTWVWHHHRRNTMGLASRRAVPTR